MRTVAVRYLVPVFAIVDLDAEPNAAGDWPADAVVRVTEDISSIGPGNAGHMVGRRFADSYDDGAVDPRRLSNAERRRAENIADNTTWPLWESV